MWQFRQLTLVLLVAGLVTGCAGALIQPRLARHYTAYVMKERTGDDPTVSVSLFTLPVLNPSSRDIFSLTAEGQAALIEGLAGKVPDANTLLRTAASRIQEDRAATFVDATTLKRRVIFSIENTSVSPADRLSWARITLTLRDNSTTFVSWDKLATERQTIDLGTLTFNQTNTVGGELGGTLTFGDVAPKVTVSSQGQLQEQVPMRRRVVTLSGALSEHKAELLQQTAAGEDLTGNVAVDFEIKVPPSAATWVTFVSHPRKPDGTADCETKPVLRRQMVTYPRDASGAIRGDVTVEYILRRVLHGHRTVPEGDDRVAFIHGSTSLPDVAIIPQSALAYNVWVLQSEAQPLHVRHIPGTPGAVLNFATPEDAERMAVWLSACGAKPVSGYELVWKGNTIPLDKKMDFEIQFIPMNASVVKPLPVQNTNQPGTTAKSDH